MKSWMKLGALAALGMSTLASAQEINMSGFASAHVTQQLGGNSNPEYYSRAANYYNFTKFGLNIGSKIDDEWAVQSQILVAGKRIEAGATDPQFGLYANWLFLAYRPNENLRFRFGRQLFPAWMVSEYVDVGYMYPWTETPHAVYELSPFKSLNGVSSDYTFQLNDSQKLTVMVFGGQEDIRIPLSQGGNLDNRYGNVVGSEVALQGKGYRFRVMATNYKINTSIDQTGGGTNNYASNSTTVVTTGFKYDKDNVLVYAEYGFKNGNKNASSVTGIDLAYNGVSSRSFDKRASAGYITVGYWFDKILPHITASTSKWETGVVEGTQDLYSLGVNYKVNDSIIFKTNVGYSVSRRGPAHMDGQGDSTTAVTGFDMLF